MRTKNGLPCDWPSNQTLFKNCYFCYFIMATFFGEIIEPSTRAIFEEFSDEEESSDQPQLHLSWIGGDKNLPPVVDVIFFVQGRLSLAFAELFLLNESCIKKAEIILTENETKSDREIDYPKGKIVPSCVYLNKNEILCLISPSFSSEVAFQFSETIAPLIKISKKVIILTNDSIYNYKTEFLHDLPPAFMKELKTSHGSEKPVGEPLEIPNFITGIPAGVFSWCQIFKKQASAFICYTDQEELDSITAAPYISVLKKISKNFINIEKPNFNKKTLFGKPEIIGGSSNIYM